MTSTDDVRGELVQRNRLTDFAGLEMPGAASFTMTGGRIDHVELDVVLSEYSANAFMPFRTWMLDNHPSDAGAIWERDSRVLTAQTAALFCQRLTFYIDEVRSEAVV